MRSILRACLVAFFLLASAAAQFSINDTELVDSTPAVVDPAKNVGTNGGATIELKNEFGVDVVVEFRKVGAPPPPAPPSGSTTVVRNTTLEIQCTLAVGTYEIWVHDADNPATRVKCGNLVVV